MEWELNRVTLARIGIDLELTLAKIVHLWPECHIHLYILSRACEAGSPMNHPGSDKTRGQG